MILVDTSIWIDHIRSPDPLLSQLLSDDQVLGHGFVVGELALGSIGQREAVLAAYRQLPRAIVAEHEEVLRLIGQRRLFGRGIGYVDVHLLASALLTPDARLWSRDRRLAAAAEALGVAARVTN